MREQKPFRILVVDDDEDDRFFITSAMKSCGIDTSYVQFAEDGDEAIDLLSQLDHDGQLPDLMLLDLNMPRMSGHDVLAELKKRDMLSRLSVVILTTSDQLLDVQRTYAAGGHSFISKPDTFEKFVEVMSCLKDYMECTIQPSYVHSF